MDSFNSCGVWIVEFLLLLVFKKGTTVLHGCASLFVGFQSLVPLCNGFAFDLWSEAEYLRFIDWNGFFQLGELFGDVFLFFFFVGLETAKA